MVQAKPRFLSFEEYLAYDDGTENLYELFTGELIEVPPESGENASIATFLLIHFAAKLGHLRVRGHGLEIATICSPLVGMLSLAAPQVFAAAHSSPG
ncbi:PDDEXK family nuclease [Leptodesmis sichuanensis]|uniref:Uma2 family endonuclease n=1 Tax=Leptodesmis sichuanensis TaxID=2906798 RepID=UPI001F251D14|nr:Uma2 family endonuclease [Leptodesmis sichuanensis A121]